MNVARSVRSIAAARKVALKTPHGEPKSQIAINMTRRYKRTSTTSTQKKGLNDVLRNQNQASNEHLYGLKPVDFSVVPSICRSPAPPPPKPGMQKYFFPLTLLITGGITAYFYFNNENDSKDYWVAMQTGGVLPGTYDDDDDDDDDDDEYEDE